MSDGHWSNSTHDWALSTDHGHLQAVRRHAERLAPTGVLHLVLEVLAYAADEAEIAKGGTAQVTFLADGSVRVADDGRGTDTRRRADGTVVRKPVMATPDLRFFDDRDAPSLADGQPRRGISVVAALSDWLVHENRRVEGCWRQRYEHGLPVSDLVELPSNGTTGTVVSFRPDPQLTQAPKTVGALLATVGMPWLRVEVTDDRQ